MGKGYAEGSAMEERQAELERKERGEREPGQQKTRAAVYASTADEPARHFLGWLEDVDPDALFTAGQAWGIQVVRQTTST